MNALLAFIVVLAEQSARNRKSHLSVE
jgi:hypothetical protein